MIPDGTVPLNSKSNPYEILHPDKYQSEKYYVSYDGRIWSTSRNKYLKPNIDRSRDRPKVKLCLNNGKKTVKVHHAVAYCFCPNGRMLHDIHHIDGDRHNNAASNIMYVANREHRELHVLKRRDMDAYFKRVAEIQQLNEWPCDRYYLVIDCDYQASANLEYGYALTEQGWEQFQQGGMDAVNNKEIVMQFVRETTGKLIENNNAIKEKNI